MAQRDAKGRFCKTEKTLGYFMRCPDEDYSRNWRLLIMSVAGIAIIFALGYYCGHYDGYKEGYGKGLVDNQPNIHKQGFSDGIAYQKRVEDLKTNWTLHYNSIGGFMVFTKKEDRTYCVGVDSDYNTKVRFTGWMCP